MGVIVSLLRGVNVGGHNKIRMDELRALYSSLGLRDAQTYLQSGNVVFRTEETDLELLCARIQQGIEHKFGIHPAVILRTAAELRAVVARNPFAGRDGIEGSKFVVIFLAGDPGQEARERVLRIEAEAEELHADGRELYIYFANGMGRPKLSPALLERTLKVSGTGRNWNTVLQLLKLAESG